MQQGHVKLDVHEEVLGLIRRSVLVLIPRLLFAFFWLLIPFFFLFQLLNGGLLGIVFFAGILLTGIWYAVVSWKKWHGTMWLITERRVIDIEQRNMRERQVSEIALKDMKDVELLRTRFLESITPLKTVHLSTKQSEHFDIELSMVQKPKDVQALLLDVQSMIMPGKVVHAAKKPHAETKNTH